MMQLQLIPVYFIHFTTYPFCKNIHAAMGVTNMSIAELHKTRVGRKP